jgi:hypothetical protein
MAKNIRDTFDGWAMSAGWPVRRRQRYRLGLLLYAVGLRKLAARVARVPTRNCPGRRYPAVDAVATVRGETLSVSAAFR